MLARANAEKFVGGLFYYFEVVLRQRCLLHQHSYGKKHCQSCPRRLRCLFPDRDATEGEILQGDLEGLLMETEAMGIRAAPFEAGSFNYIFLVLARTNSMEVGKLGYLDMFL